MYKNDLNKAFINYVSKFDNTLDKIISKKEHTLRVADYSQRIAKNSNLNEEDVYLAYAIGVLHDIGRFYQWQEYRNFNDHQTIDHAKYAVDYLQKDGGLEEFGIDRKFEEIINFAILYHNKKDIEINDFSFSSDIEKERAVIHAKIIRDADKLDNFEIVSKGLIVAFNRKTTSGSGFSDNVYKEFLSKQQVTTSNIKTMLDRTLFTMALVTDLNYKYSKKVLKDMKFAKKFYKIYLNEFTGSDKEKFKEFFKYFKTNILK